MLLYICSYKTTKREHSKWRIEELFKTALIKLREEEYKSLPYVILSNQLICVAWFSEQEKYKDMLEINQEMTNWLIANFDKLKID